MHAGGWPLTWLLTDLAAELGGVHIDGPRLFALAVEHRERQRGRQFRHLFVRLHVRHRVVPGIQ